MARTYAASTRTRASTVSGIAALVLLVVLGFFPQLLLNDINPAVDRTMAVAGQTDPQPAVPLAGEAK